MPLLEGAVNSSLQYIYDKQKLLDEIGRPQFADAEKQLRIAKAAREEMRRKYAEMREVVLESKNVKDSAILVFKALLNLVYFSFSRKHNSTNHWRPSNGS